jgi:hypothetical protein
LTFSSIFGGVIHEIQFRVSRVDEAFSRHRTSRPADGFPQVWLASPIEDPLFIVWILFTQATDSPFRKYRRIKGQQAFLIPSSVHVSLPWRRQLPCGAALAGNIPYGSLPAGLESGWLASQQLTEFEGQLLRRMQEAMDENVVRKHYLGRKCWQFQSWR